MVKKSGFVAIAGKPNAGKSTLLNAVLGQSIAIVTPKPQTTRNRIFGIYTKDNVQIIFVDTPGILKTRYMLQAFMKKETESSFVEADIIILVVDAHNYSQDSLNEVYNKYRKEFRSHKIFCALNKIDLLSKNNVLVIIDNISKNFRFDEIIPLSSKTGFNIDDFLETVKKYLPENEFYFEGDIVAAQPEKFFVSEIIRAQALKMYKEEIPFSLYVDIEEFKERGKGKDYIRAGIILEKDSQKPIVIGKKGAMIKLLGERSRKDIEEFLGHEVFLELFVKIRKNWKNDEEFLKRNFSKANIPAV
jgi:GTP-binding protein Era